jgi:uncharacterized 2Fe-2S/4Fe-4S cluster protein (DUF4445 family)
MSRNVRITLEPGGHVVVASRGEPLRELLFDHGTEFPCGGRGRCRSCRVRVLAGRAEPTAHDLQALGEQAVAEGWRLGCLLAPSDDLVLAVAQWQGPVLEDRTPVAAQPRPGLGVAIDLGTTTLVAQLADLQTGSTLATRAGLNPQGRHGADLISRLEAAVQGGRADELRQLIRARLGALIAALLVESGRAEPLVEIVLVGNTVMHHLFCGRDLEPLAAAPYETGEGGPAEFRSRELG